MYAYHTEWLLAPFIILVLSVLFFKNAPRRIIISLVAAVILALPLLFIYLSQANTGARANTEMIWSYAAGFHPASLLHTFTNNYFSYTNPGYLFFNGLNLFPKPGPYEQGLFLWPLIIPFFYGLFNLQKINRKYFLFFLIWLFVSPVVTSLTHDGNFIRNLVSVLPYTILISLGLKKIIDSRRILFFAEILLILITFGLFGIIYLVHFPLARAESYQGYQPLAAYLAASKINPPRIIIDYRFGRYNEYSGVPHLYFGYYNRWDPADIQHRLNTPAGWFYGNYQVTWLDWNSAQVTPGYLYIVSPANTPTPGAKRHLQLLRSFVDYSGMPSFEIWQGY
jgi:hypothetical protein